MLIPSSRLEVPDHLFMQAMLSDSVWRDYHDGVDDQTREGLIGEARRELDQMGSPRGVFGSSSVNRFVADRAERYCQVVLSMDTANLRQRWDQTKRQVRGLVIVSLLLFFAFMTLFGPFIIFDEHGRANLTKLFIGFAISLFFTTVPMISLSWLWIRRWWRPANDAAESRMGWLAWVAWSGIETGLRLTRRSVDDSIENQVELVERLRALIHRQRDFAACVIGFWASLLVAASSIFILLGLLYYLKTENVSYAMPGSLDNPEQRGVLVRFFALPVEKFTTIETPSAEAISWVSDADLTIANASNTASGIGVEDHFATGAQRLRYLQDHRQIWSWFLIGCFMTWAVLPRCFFVFLFAMSAWRTSGDPLPHRSEIFALIRLAEANDKLESAPPITPPPITPPPITPPPITPPPITPPPIKPPAPEPPTKVHTDTHKPLTILGRLAGEFEHAKKAFPPIDHAIEKTTVETILIGYRLNNESFQWAQKLCVRTRGLTCGINVQNLDDEEEVVEAADPQQRLFLIAPINALPDDNYREFLGDLRQKVEPTVILTDDNHSVNNETDQANRQVALDAWKTMTLQAGVPASRFRIQSLCNPEGIESLSAWMINADANSLVKKPRLVGRYQTAARCLSEATTLSIPQSNAIDEVFEALAELYAPERQSLLDQACSAMNRSKLPEKESLRKVARQVQSIDLQQVVQTPWAGLIKHAIGSAFREVPVGWTLAGGFAGAGAVVATGVAAFATGGIAMTIIPALVATVPIAGVSGAVLSTATKRWLSMQRPEADLTDIAVDEPSRLLLVKSGILQIMLYELRGNPEELIRETIKVVTNRLDDLHPPDGPSMIASFVNEMNLLKGTQ